MRGTIFKEEIRYSGCVHKLHLKQIYVIGLLVVLVGCRPSNNDSVTLATRVVNALSQKDWKSVSRFVHPEHGLRFTPYGRVDLSRDVVITRKDVAELVLDDTVRRWGQFDGTGDPINLTIDEYYRRFIYDRDYAGLTSGPPNQRLGQGNSLNNIPTVFGDREVIFLEYYAPGTQKYKGMDWRSLRIVLERTDGRWYLIGLVHDEWTI